jgi:AI-2E family transporter
LHAYWSQAHADLPAFVQKVQPRIGHRAKAALDFVAGVGGGLLMFLAAFLVAGIIMAFGAEGARASEVIFSRIMSPQRAPEFVKLSTATVRAVAQGVIGVALIQAIAVGVTLMVANVPFAVVLAMIVLALGIAQIPALLVTILVIVYIWMSGQYGTARAGWHGCGRHPRAVRRRGPVGARLSDFHGLRASWAGGDRLAAGKLIDVGPNANGRAGAAPPRQAVRRGEPIPSPAAAFFFMSRWPLPGVLVELLEHAHHHADAHHEGCDFHDSSPAVAPGWRAANPEGEMLQSGVRFPAFVCRCIELCVVHGGATR